MDYLKELGTLALASRMKRIVDTLRKEAKAIYQSNEVNFDVSLMPLLKLIEQQGEVEINQAARLLGISQPAVTQFCDNLIKRGLVEVNSSTSDLRKKRLVITNKGAVELKELNKIWKSMSNVLDEMLKISDHDLMEAMGSLEMEMSKTSFSELVSNQLAEMNDQVEILGFTDSLAPYFKSLNYEWIEKYFEVEDSDEYKLSNPREAIIDPGGFIYFARHSGQIIGTTALIKVSEGIYEIAKMAVNENYQKKGIGRKLLNHLIRKGKELSLKKLVLYSNTDLAPAINMYFKEGFRVIPKDDHHNNRANIKMQLTL